MLPFKLIPFPVDYSDHCRAGRLFSEILCAAQAILKWRQSLSGVLVLCFDFAMIFLMSLGHDPWPGDRD